MTPAPEVFMPRNRLSGALSGSGGSSPALLVAEANRRVDQRAEAIRAYVSAKVGAILAYGAMDDTSLRADSERLGGLGRDIADVAAAAGLGAIGEVAYGIAALSDAARTRGVWRADAVRLHIAALQGMESSDRSNGSESRAMLEHLKRLRVFLGVLD